MAKCNGDIEIGKRMAEEFIRIFGSPAKTERCAGIPRHLLYDWKSGVTPGGFMLAKLHYCGGDVLYVLTGKRGGDRG